MKQRHAQNRRVAIEDESERLVLLLLSSIHVGVVTKKEKHEKAKKGSSGREDGLI
ncbi:hypothetical protein HPP92_007313 [Vanilla planifolia]|uniref:Uncharacterized protein n=1 Tax=Vanilla planifolia TaxID=51239 RepID=A0A835VB51_VANPL|nr:hypothetical protein HPP92_007313 [Vanilla planifolia]